MTHKITFVCAVIFALFHGGAALKCYIGSGDTIKTDDCRGSCISITVKSDDKTTKAKACSPVHFDDGCHETTVLVYTKTCYCNSDYCNAAPAALSAASWTMALSALALALRGALF
ncbi:uncharacterized protein LOC122242927 [Penaeus japonicus]|uniref:uncharacterized protein LOC122242927 n=1 Tax=Penaeus japonicus TaxID=27405 RepID=UPI001C7147D6|nr:uncharacterized protein LOC122242927 [Penaeus japonicus]XP_042856293.1 uncharacterized protein LOC122242927 [Penaeus japonicus]XP_042856294.1 uncharacterized protein LOC122242927 [Penaeus japonicus]